MGKFEDTIVYSNYNEAVNKLLKISFADFNTVKAKTAIKHKPKTVNQGNQANFPRIEVNSISTMKPETLKFEIMNNKKPDAEKDGKIPLYILS